jgi:hypothetical protein
MNKARGKIMTDYVKQRAIGFAEWLDENHWIRDRTNMWYQYIGESIHARDIEWLYEEFLKTVVE